MADRGSTAADRPSGLQHVRDSDHEGDDEDGGQTGQSPRPQKKARKQRPTYSCNECRRLKMRCDRQVPCHNCVRRGRTEQCSIPPTGQASSRQQPSDHAENQSSSNHHVAEVPAERNNTGWSPACHAHPEQEIYLNRSVSNMASSNHENGSHAPQVPVYPAAQNFVASDTFHNVSFAALASAHTSGSVFTPPGHPVRAERPSPVYNAPTTASGFSYSSSARPDGEEKGSHGTLMLSGSGQSRYLGPTAGSEWLKDSETQDASQSPFAIEALSPEPSDHTHAASNTQTTGYAESIAPIAFPFSLSPARIRTRDLLTQLPPREEAWALVESYYRYCAWHHDVAPRAIFQPTFERVYALSERRAVTSATNAQEIALVFIILAQGTIFNIELPSYDPSVEEWLQLSERALVKGNFLSIHTIAGLQTLHLMAHLHLHLDKGRRGDQAWPLWGLVMRLVQAMGMHRDGVRWNLPEAVAEERRRIFWECNSADIFQAHCFSRPCALNSEHCDTAFPSNLINADGEKDYTLLRFELSQLSSEILNMAMKVRNPSYEEVCELDLKLCEFERQLPFGIRCRAALLAMPSRYPELEDATKASPEPSRRSMKISFQQTNLALNISETIINLHRPYFARALYGDREHEPTATYMPSFLTVIERCSIMVAIVSDIHARFPAISTRQWNFWFHVFNSALCLGTLILRDPGNLMAPFALTQIDSAIGLFTSLTQHGAGTPRYYRNLQWLLKLRSRASSKIHTVASTRRNSETEANRENGAREEGEDVELLGWRTRLIERSDRERQTIKTIHLPTSLAESNLTNQQAPGRPTTGQGSGYGDASYGAIPSQDPNGASLSNLTHDPTDELLHDFWDPLLLQDMFGASSTQDQQSRPFVNDITMNWWELDGLAGPSGFQG